MNKNPNSAGNRNILLNFWKHIVSAKKRNQYTCQRVLRAFTSYGKFSSTIYERVTSLLHGSTEQQLDIQRNMNFCPFGLWQMFPKEGPNEANNKISHSPPSFLGFHASLFSMDVHFCGVFSLLTCKSSLPIISIAKVLKWCWQHRTIDVKWMA